MQRSANEVDTKPLNHTLHLNTEKMCETQFSGIYWAVAYLSVNFQEPCEAADNLENFKEIRNNCGNGVLQDIILS